MQTSFQESNRSTRDIIQETIGIYPVTSLGISFYYHCTVDLLICRKDGVTSQLFANDPTLNIQTKDELKQIDISGQFVNGMIQAFNEKRLPSTILCTPPYCFIEDLTNELAEISALLMSEGLLKGHANLKRFYFPTVILASNGIIYDEIIYNLHSKLEKLKIPELIIKNICSKIVRGSIMQGAYREDNIYLPHTKGLIKIALPKFPLFSTVVDLLNSKEFTFSIHTNPHRIEFEKAMVNIATNTIAMLFALDKQNLKLNRIVIKNALSPENSTHSTLVREVQIAIFEIGKKAGAFSQSDTFEKVWGPRKEQILKHDSSHTSSSLYCYKNMIKTQTFPDGIPDAENALLYPLKCFAKHYQLFDEVLLIEEIERMLLRDLEFARKNAGKITTML